uniref:MADF domain-containing protein n=1 Tax=Anopheles atroparvus TaxID=41427 RepID=A0AAG5CQW8_ANOAO
MDSTDSNLEGAEESVPVNSNDGKRARTVDMGRKGTIQFIKLIKSAVCLWNRKHPLYKHRISQCNAWKEISMRMGVPSSELQYKWRSLQSSYRHFRSSYSKARLQGAYPTTKWFAYDAMRFLSVMKEVDDTNAQSKGRSKQESAHLASKSMDEQSEGAEESVPVQGSEEECGDENAESVGGSKQESVYLVTESIVENSEGDEESVTVQGSEDDDGVTNAGSVDCLNQESVFVAMESMDEEAADESDPVQGIRKRNKTIDLGQKGSINLIQLIKKAPCLWYRRHPQYRDNMRQNEAWKEISMQIGVPISQLQHKWRSLQSSYRWYSRAQMKGATPQVRWFAYDAMRFLSDMKEGGDTNAESVGRSKQESVYLVTESIGENSEGDEEYVTVQGSEDVDGNTKVGSVDCLNQESVFVAMESMDEEATEESVPVQGIRKRNKTVDLGTKGTIQFIKLVKLSVCLWNRKHPLYKDKMAQCKAWKEISMQMGVPSSELQYKWRSLQSSYRHFRSSYSKPRPYPTKRWFAYQAMRFLSDMKEVGDSNAQSVGRAKQVSVHLAVESMDEHSEGAAESVPVQGMKEYGDTKEDLVSMSNENTLYLISLIKSHGCVWNKQDADHKNATRKQEAWESISQAMGYSVEALQDKFTSLRSAYRNYCSRYRKNGDAKPSWFAYDALRFLDDKSHDDQPLDTNLIPDEGSQALSENFPVEKIKTEPMSDVVTIVNLRDKSVICKRVNQVSSKYPTRNPSKLDAQMDGRLKRILPIQKRPPIVIRRVTQPQTRVKDPLQIEDPLQIKLPTDARQTITYGNSQPRNSDAGSGTRLSSVKSFLSYLEHELCQLSKESMTLAQMEMLQIMSDYKLRDIRKSQSQTDAKKAKSMESTGTQTDPVNETVKGTIVSSELCFAELSLEHGDDNLFFNH